MEYVCPLEQRSSNSNPWTKSGLPAVFVNKVETWPHPFVCIFSVNAFMLQQQSCLAVTAKNKIFTVGYFIDKFADSWSRG